MPRTKILIRWVNRIEYDAIIKEIKRLSKEKVFTPDEIKVRITIEEIK